MSTAINIFLRQTVRQNDLPFVVTARPSDLRGKPAEGVAEETNKRDAMFGCLRGKYTISDDFDAPLEDFKEYTK
jgi:antitoxin component of RelBE/YafQ-DinJ toxin-antitoxin module